MGTVTVQVVCVGGGRSMSSFYLLYTFIKPTFQECNRTIFPVWYFCDQAFIPIENVEFEELIRTDLIHVVYKALTREFVHKVVGMLFIVSKI